MNKKIFLIIFLMVLGFSNISETYAANAKSVQVVNPMSVVKHPNKYLNSYIKMNVIFDKFSALGLDYSKVNRKSDDYIGFLVQRNDVADHNVPMSEMKLFLKKDYAEKFVELNTGDKLEISGRVFSSALGDAWIDVDKIVVTQKAKKTETNDGIDGTK